MPEGPEVQTVVNALTKLMVGKKIISFHSTNHSTIQTSNFNLVNKTISVIQRHGKYIDFVFNDKSHLIIHLGMTGYFRTDEQPKYIFSLQTSTNQIYFYDPRKFGKVWYLTKEEFHNFKQIATLGPDGIDSTPEVIINKIKEDSINKKQEIKPYLMDGHNISGIGNIYASEVLFLSGILPTRKINSLSDKEIKILAYNIPKILKRSLEQGGSTIKNFSNVDGVAGNYQNNHYVYQQLICKSCGGVIQQIKQAGRSTFYCPNEQQ